MTPACAGRPGGTIGNTPGLSLKPGPARIRVIPDSQAGVDGAMIGGWRQALIPGRPRAPILGPPVAQGTGPQATGPYGAGPHGHGPTRAPARRMLGRVARDPGKGAARSEPGA